jgi:hypothetical protein
MPWGVVFVDHQARVHVAAGDFQFPVIDLAPPQAADRRTACVDYQYRRYC